MSRTVKPNDLREPPFDLGEALLPQAMKLVLQDIVPASIEISKFYDSMSNE